MLNKTLGNTNKLESKAICLQGMGTKQTQKLMMLICEQQTSYLGTEKTFQDMKDLYTTFVF